MTACSFIKSPLLATVVSCTRRSARILLADTNETATAKLAEKLEPVVVGDIVDIETRNEHLWISALNPRKNYLTRSYGNRIKRIAANLDRIYLVSAPKELCQLEFVDRVLVTASIQNIPVCLVYNKADLVSSNRPTELDIYKALGYELIFTSTVNEPDITALTNLLNNNDKHIALVGLSGVGKSSLLNRLIPSAMQNVNTVSHKSGKGQQTTTRAEGFIYINATNGSLLISDLPGIQNFGTSALPQHAIANCFSEFTKYSQTCEYSDCQHIEEPNCAVKIALNSGSIALSRYKSYISILSEIKAFKRY